MKVKHKLLTSFVLVSFFAAASTGFISYQVAKKALLKEEYNKLNTARETKKRQVENYFEHIGNQIVTLSENYTIIDAVRQFTDAFYSVSKDEDECDLAKTQLEQYYKESYIPAFNSKSKIKLNLDDVFPTDVESIFLQNRYIVVPKIYSEFNRMQCCEDHFVDYETAHEKYHSILKRYSETFNYYDMFLVDAEKGFVIYSEEKDIEFATNLKTGLWRNTNLGIAYRQALASDEHDFFVFTDFELYKPDFRQPSAFIASPIFDGNEKTGVLIFQIMTEKLNSIMTNDFNWSVEGMGNTGECFLVGADLLMRSESRHLFVSPQEYKARLKSSGFSNNIIEDIIANGSAILTQPVPTEAVQKALKGQTGTGILTNYLNEISLTSYSPLIYKNLNWAIISESNLEFEQVFLSLTKLRLHSVAFSSLIALLGAIISMLVSNLITTPLEKIFAGTKEITEGKPFKRVTLNSKDELGQLADSLNLMAEKLYATTYSKNQMDSLLNSMNDALFLVEPENYNGRELIIKMVNNS